MVKAEDIPSDERARIGWVQGRLGLTLLLWLITSFNLWYYSLSRASLALENTVVYTSSSMEAESDRSVRFVRFASRASKKRPRIDSGNSCIVIIHSTDFSHQASYKPLSR